MRSPLLFSGIWKLRWRPFSTQKKQPSGLIRIGAPIEFGKYFFPVLFAAFRKKYPDVIFSMTLDNAPGILSMVNAGELDLGLVDIFMIKDLSAGELDMFSIDPLINEQVSLVCSKAYYDKYMLKDHSYDNLATKDFISYQHTSSTLQQWFKHHFGRSPKDLSRIVTVDNNQAVINCIRNDLGLGVVSRHMVLKDIKKRRIVPITTGKTDIVNKISLVQLQNKIPTLTEKTFIRFLIRDIQRPEMAVAFGMPSSGVDL